MTPKSTNKAQPVEVAEAKAPESEPAFTCRFCGQEKPLGELVLIRHYYPPLAACRDCFKINNNT